MNNEIEIWAVELFGQIIGTGYQTMDLFCVILYSVVNRKIIGDGVAETHPDRNGLNVR